MALHVMHYNFVRTQRQTGPVPLNPMDHVWRSVKPDVCANHQDTIVDLTVARFLRYLRQLTPRAALVKAGTRSARFWLRRALSNRR
ncbi:hypothetical protein [Sorangium sp. So ce363]|uniref:hypothetical protein n=1 Tax=Sorangium sp. So ce363 TaxID=3133304 RepID=UPI003F633F03